MPNEIKVTNNSIQEFDVPSTPVTSVNNKAGAVILNQDDIGAGENYTQYSKGEQKKLADIDDSLVGITADELRDSSVTGEVIENHERRITQLEKHISNDYFYTDDAIAHRKIVPANACPYAQLNKIGGMTYTTKNLFNGELLKGYFSDADFKISAPASSKYRSIQIYLSKGTYTLSSNGNISLIKAILDGVYYAAYSQKTFTTTIDGYIGLTLKNSDDSDWVDGTLIQIEKGEVATPYEPYFEGLRDSKVTALKVHSKNLFDGELLKGYYIDADFTRDAPTSPIFRSIKIYLPKGTYTLSSNGDILMINAIFDGVYHAAYGKKTFTTTIDGYVGIAIKNSDNTDWVDGTLIQIERGDTATEYVPFGAIRTIALPEELQNIDGLGQGIGNYSNTIDLENGIYTKQPFKTAVLTGKELMGLYCREAYGNGVTIHGVLDGSYKYATGICTDTDKVGLFPGNHQNSLWLGSDGTVTYWLGILDVLGFTGDDDGLKAFKQWLADRYANDNPVTIIYKSDYEEPTEEPIEADIITDFDNFIEVEANGSIEFVNEYEQAVPSSITYLLKEGAI